MAQINDNVQGRINKIASKLKDEYDVKMNEVVEQKQKEWLGKLLNMYPQLQNEKQNIISTCLDVKKKETQTSRGRRGFDEPIKPGKDPIVLTQFKFDNITYYKDNNHGIWNEKAELIGSFLQKEGEELQCFFFDDHDSDNSINFDISEILDKELESNQNINSVEN